LIFELGRELLHFFFKRFVIFFDCLAAHITTGGEYIILLDNLFGRDQLAETGSVLVLAAIRTAPIVIGIGDFLNILVR
jgi:hypothetical protein